MPERKMPPHKRLTVAYYRKVPKDLYLAHKASCARRGIPLIEDFVNYLKESVRKELAIQRRAARNYREDPEEGSASEATSDEGSEEAE